MGERTVTTPDGLRTFVRTHGEATSAPPVVCIPGLTRNSRDFEDVAPHLAADRLVVAVDLRGRGRSDRDPTAQSYTVATYADDVRAVLDELGLDTVVLLGTSLGGLTSMWFGATHPERVAGIVLNDIGPAIEPEGAARIGAYAGKLPPPGTWAEAVAQTRFVSEDAAPDLTDERWLHVARQRYREEPDGTVVVDHDPGIATGPPPDRDPWEVFDALSGIPVLVLRGATSDILSAATVAEMARRHPGLEAVEVPGRGHAPMLDEDVARAALDAFLAARGR